MGIKKYKHIAFYLPSAGLGGAQRTMIELASGFSERGWEVDMLFSVKEGPLLYLLNDNIRIIEFKSRRIISVIPKIIRYISKEKPEILILSLRRPSMVGIFSTLITKHKPFIITRVDSIVSLQLQHNKHRNWFKNTFESYLYYYLLKYSNIIVSVSKGVKYDLIAKMKHSDDRITTIYNPVNIEGINEKLNEMNNHELFNEIDYHLIVSVGRLAPPKDFITLIRAVEILNKNVPSRLAIFGEGSERENLEKHIREHKLTKIIKLFGYTDNPFKYINKADVFVLSSAWEGMGNVLIESLAVGTPVVSTDCISGPAEILDNGRYGKLVPVGDAHAMAEAIKDTIKNPPSREFLKERARHFEINSIIDQYTDLIRDGHGNEN